jgi:SAM-dependent methyltransferase
MQAPQETDSRAYWRESWSSVGDEEPRDVWYAVDQVKFRYLQRYLPPNGRSLEVGCGSARVSRFLAALGFEVVGLDYEAGAIQLAGRRFRDSRVKGELLLGDAFALPFADQTFDVVLSTGLLEHFADPSPIVAEMARVLRCGGLFYSDIVPRKFSLLRALDFLRIHRADLFERSFTKEEIAVLLRNAGLSPITVFPAGIFPPFLPLLQRCRTVDHLHRKLAGLFQNMSPRFDGTKAAGLLGLYYFACAQKPQPLRGSPAEKNYAGAGYEAQRGGRKGQYAGSTRR